MYKYCIWYLRDIQIDICVHFNNFIIVSDQINVSLLTYTKIITCYSSFQMITLVYISNGIRLKFTGIDNQKKSI